MCENILSERFEFRPIHPDETDQAIAIEQECFPPNEACSAKDMTDRIRKAGEMFLAAVDRATGKIAGFLNGLSTNEEFFRDEFFTDADLYDPEGRNIMLLGLDVLPQYRGQGLARELMVRFLRRERQKRGGQGKAVLTCHRDGKRSDIAHAPSCFLPASRSFYRDVKHSDIAHALPSGKAILTCHKEKVEMYQKMGFSDCGISASVWGGEEWHEMSCPI